MPPHDTVDRRPGGHLADSQSWTPGPEGRQTRGTSQAAQAGCGRRPSGAGLGRSADDPLHRVHRRLPEEGLADGSSVWGPPSSSCFTDHWEATVAIERTKVGSPSLPTKSTIKPPLSRSKTGRRGARSRTGFSHQFVDFLGARSILIDFTQPGSQGPEHVRLYTLPPAAPTVVPGDLHHDEPTFDKCTRKRLQRIAFMRDSDGSS
jgi:hypothetical protein